MKKKILTLAFIIALMLCVFTLAVSAKTYTVKYDGQSFTQTTDENGQVKLRDTIFGNTNADKTFFGWFTLKGDMYKPGETVTLTEDITLHQAYGYKGTNKSLPLGGDSQWDWPFIQLQEDLVLDSSMNPPWGGCATVDLNGHTITTSAKNAAEQTRGGIRFVGKGEVIHTGSGNFFNCATHGYGDGSQYLLIGKDVKVTTGGTLFYYTNWINSNIPVKVYGDVTCKQLLYINSFGDSKAVNVEIEPVSLTVTGESLITCGTYPKVSGNQAINVSITGGLLKLSESADSKQYWVGNATEGINITVTGGTFTNGNDIIKTYVPSDLTLAEITLDGTVHYVVLKQGECIHSYVETAKTSASCIALATSTFTCSKCNDSYTVTFGSISEHTWTLLSDKEPTQTSVGVREYECSVCKEPKTELYYNDVADETIKAKVSKDGSVYEVNVRAGDIYNLEALGENKYKLLGIKDFDSYLATDVIEISIPIGITEMNVSTNNSSIQKIIFEDGAIVTVKSFSRLTAVTHIEIKAADVTFAKGASNNVIQSIRSDVSGASVAFEAEAFAEKSTLSELTINAGSVYVLGNACFKHTGVKEFVVPDYTDITFKNEGAFYEGSLEYVYIGRGIKALNGKPFDRCKYLNKVVLMEVETMNAEWNFCVPTAADNVTALEVYIHSSTISLPNNTFYFRSGVTVYTNAPITNSSAFSNCTTYTIVYGIPHKLERGHVDSTCTETGVTGYITSCPCGENLNGTAVARVFNTCLTNTESYYEEIYDSIVIPAKGHREGEITYVEYLNGFNANGIKTCICSVCSESYVESEGSATPLINFLGYSTNESKTEIAVGYEISLEALEIYQRLSGKQINYGVVGAITVTLGGLDPLSAQGAAVARCDVSSKYPSFNLRIKGLNESLYSLGLTMSAYVIETDAQESESTLVYIQDKQSTNPSSYTMNELLAVPPSSDEE